MTQDELREVQSIIGLLAMPSTQFASVWADGVFDVIVKYGNTHHVWAIAKKAYGNNCEKIVLDSFERWGGQA